MFQASIYIARAILVCIVFKNLQNKSYSLSNKMVTLDQLIDKNHNYRVLAPKITATSAEIFR